MVSAKREWISFGDCCFDLSLDLPAAGRPGYSSQGTTLKGCEMVAASLGDLGRLLQIKGDERSARSCRGRKSAESY